MPTPHVNMVYTRGWEWRKYSLASLKFIAYTAAFIFQVPVNVLIPPTFALRNLNFLKAQASKNQTSADFIQQPDFDASSGIGSQNLIS
jgi:hypothetical protein